MSKYEGEERRQDYSQILERCLKCDKKCANCIDNKLQMNEVRDDFYSFQKKQLVLNTRCKDKMEIVDTMPAMKRDLYITMGTSVVVMILLVVIFRANATMNNDITNIKTNIKESSLHIEESKENEQEQKKRNKEMNFMQSDISYLKQKTDKMDEKIDLILERLPKS